MATYLGLIYHDGSVVAFYDCLSMSCLTVEAAAQTELFSFDYIGIVALLLYI
jgi:hypothetical protein